MKGKSECQPGLVFVSMSEVLGLTTNTKMFSYKVEKNRNEKHVFKTQETQKANLTSVQLAWYEQAQFLTSYSDTYLIFLYSYWF